MHQDFWNSPAAVVRPGESVFASTVAIGRLHEMVEYLLSLPAALRAGLRLVSEALKDPLGPAETEALRRREDFPVVC